jgi:hypothetical protein
LEELCGEEEGEEEEEEKKTRELLSRASYLLKN